MKTANVRFFGSLIILLTLIFSQYIFAGIIRDDDPTTTVTRSARSRTAIEVIAISPVSADLVGGEIMINFNSKVGFANVTIEDEMGNIIYQASVDTNSTSEVTMPIDNLATGDYTVTVVYNSTVFEKVIRL